MIVSLSSYQLCHGISNVAAAKSIFFKKHCVPKLSNSDMDTDDNVPIIQTEFNRSSSCEVLSVSLCKHCVNAEKKELKSLKRKAENLTVLAKLKAPISLTSPERVKFTL